MPVAANPTKETNVGTKKHAQRKRGTPKLKLEVGKHYKTRDGRVVRIVAMEKGQSDWPFVGDNGFSFRSDGRFFEEAPENLDLISRCPAPRDRRLSEPQGTFIKIWKHKAGRVYSTVHYGRAAADKAKKKDCKLIGVVRHSKRKGLEVVS